ncbi:hypothetical protein [Tepidibacter thalassicus]|uniref:Uncharacterized protein n=1 Tax=Tepidibacter thalassicus DSM 15285 TaxID=1123350 RepID=A0A1M5PF82_9FIRM|nr:hypothetical protein [Tepidibacter thalassicus]SHH00377.1 hypothetical protein SAMN02744040_00449 [Tepidibacter thalassicus DSM 15285]
MNNKMLIALAILAFRGDKILNTEMNVFENFRNINLDNDKLERGIEILSRSKKYMRKDEKALITKVESMLDLVRGIKRLNNINDIKEFDESDFFRSMDIRDRRNMMIKEIIDVFPEDKKSSINKILDMKKKMYLLKELMSSGVLEQLSDINQLEEALGSEDKEKCEKNEM